MERVVLSHAEYGALRLRKWGEQSGKCAYCPRSLSLGGGELHHVKARGFGSAFRDDSQVELVCYRCHPKADRLRKSKFST